MTSSIFGGALSPTSLPETPPVTKSAWGGISEEAKRIRVAVRGGVAWRKKKKQRVPTRLALVSDETAPVFPPPKAKYIPALHEHSVLKERKQTPTKPPLAADYNCKNTLGRKLVKKGPVDEIMMVVKPRVNAQGVAGVPASEVAMAEW